MLRSACLLLLFVFSIQAANIYQQCGAFYGDNLYTLDPLVKNMTDTPYSYKLNFTHTLYYNFCAGTTKCKGAMMCVEGPHGLSIIASAGDDAHSSWSSSYGVRLYYYPANYYISLSFFCTSLTNPLTVTQVEYGTHSTYMYFETPLVCQAEQAVSRVPSSHTYMSGQIYMAGVMPMWSFDHVATLLGNSFVGNFYYSFPDRSFKLNGTLSNSQGQKSPVEMIVNGRQSAITTVSMFQPTSGNTVCSLLPAPKSSGSLQWFSSNVSYESVVRSYESIYWDKGATFNVTEYFHTGYYSLMQRSSDSATVALGQYFLVPFVDANYNTLVSEVKWDSLNYGTLAPSTFEIPVTCKQ